MIVDEKVFVAVGVKEAELVILVVPVEVNVGEPVELLVNDNEDEPVTVTVAVVVPECDVVELIVSETVELVAYDADEECVNVAEVVTVPDVVAVLESVLLAVLLAEDSDIERDEVRERSDVLLLVKDTDSVKLPEEVSDTVRDGEIVLVMERICDFVAERVSERVIVPVTVED